MINYFIITLYYIILLNIILYYIHENMKPYQNPYYSANEISLYLRFVDT